MSLATPDRLDAARGRVLARMERAERNVRLGLAAAAVLELAMLVVALRLTDLRDPVQRLVFVMAVMTFTLLALGLAVLGAHVSRSVGRVLAAMDGADAVR